ncbi:MULTISPECIES: GFA family protein [unclassified Oleiphilus]|jgi:hypothetical protein|uniref:GFA family protein n=2 Tax=Oleiphilus TaxID=141450 RepID=UPI0007C23B57|nr:MULTISPECIES: GFA family protein [unclassified Oleiphilus]KZY78711.1 hypothetical protein A3740_07485 [Oleiphilus sp. HI0068]KZY86121.1 hypothetical protein A3743_17615 [Oleiphilus sp. HI0072]KZY87045.1 hypothetical protein A3741_13750 [Oleiphilus sp. HI0069]KZZ16775.1 hypothetical protein A3749_04385 [Oleiphilus sp. HI0078]KZZ21150.1 hypothetical protein A3752_01240 [Oleiphilus sp. HI0081]
MTSQSFHQSASCSCTTSKITVRAQPFSRFKCHCTICQEIYNKPYAEFVVVNAKNVELNKSDQLLFAKYRRPPALTRGICQNCQSPLVGFLRLAPFLKLAFIPIDRFEDPGALPAAQGHIFYHSRSEEIDDNLPKFSGYWKSELAVSQSVLKGLIQH